MTYAPGKPSFFVNKWRSRNDLFTRPDPVIGDLVSCIEHHANRWEWPANPAGKHLAVTSMWAIVAQHGMHGRKHRHLGVVSGAYYVDEGDDAGPMSGAFVAIEEDPFAERIFPPQAGALMLFRSDMEHAVTQYQGTRPRIVISFNLTAEGDAGEG